MVGRLTTGVPGLDKLLEGGFPAGSAILLVGPPGCGKSTICQQFIFEGLKNSQPATYITLDLPPQEILESMTNFGLNAKKYSEKLKFIDAYSWRVGKGDAENAISNLGNVNELNIAVTEAMRQLAGEKQRRLVLDSISTLLLYADPSLVVKLIPVIIAKGKDNGFTQLLVLEEGVHDEKTVTTLNYITDGVVEFKMEEDNRFLRVSRMKATEHKRDWFKFAITNKGVVLK